MSSNASWNEWTAARLSQSSTDTAGLFLWLRIVSQQWNHHLMWLASFHFCSQTLGQAKTFFTSCSLSGINNKLGFGSMAREEQTGKFTGTSMCHHSLMCYIRTHSSDRGCSIGLDHIHFFLLFLFFHLKATLFCSPSSSSHCCTSQYIKTCKAHKTQRQWSNVSPTWAAASHMILYNNSCRLWDLNFILTSVRQFYFYF